MHLHNHPTAAATTTTLVVQKCNFKECRKCKVLAVNYKVKIGLFCPFKFTSENVTDAMLDEERILTFEADPQMVLHTSLLVYILQLAFI